MITSHGARTGGNAPNSNVHQFVPRQCSPADYAEAKPDASYVPVGKILVSQSDLRWSLSGAFLSGAIMGVIAALVTMWWFS